MDQSKPAENPLQAGLSQAQPTPPCAFVIFGASGDLTKRKLVPALYNLSRSELLPSGFSAIGVARRPKSDEDFRQEMDAALEKFSRRKPSESDRWPWLRERLGYQQGTFEAPETYAGLGKRLQESDDAFGTAANRVFYLAIAPRAILTVVKGLSQAGLLKKQSPQDPGFTRLVVEKPFGENLESAQDLNRELLEYVNESQLYRIDHYLGKETVQNMLVLRFANAIFEPLWNRKHISHVEISVAEYIGVEGRGRFYEQVGITRDIVQNHVLQLLTIVAMEPPVSLEADAVRDEKVKVLKSLRPITGENVFKQVVRGQYAGGFVRGDKVSAYRDEPDVAEQSQTDTYVAMELGLENWRWQGVPFFLRAGKRLHRKVAEVAVHFRSPPLSLFGPTARKPNSLIMRVQPDEGIALRFDTKVPGAELAIREVAMDFRYGTAFAAASPEAYERLILDTIKGDATLFTRGDEVEEQWRFIDPIVEAWQGRQDDLAMYEAGSYGPAAADELIGRHGFVWRKP